MAEAILDFAGLEDSAAAATGSEVDTTGVDSEIPELGTDESTQDTPTTEEGTEGAEGKDTETHNADGTEKTPEEQAAFKKSAEEAAKNAEPVKATPDNVRKTLKSLRDSDPKNAQVVKELHGAYERFNAYKAEFPTVAAAKEAKAFIDTIGGVEGYQKTQEQMDAVSATDELLYNGDPKLWDNVIEDLKTSGHPEALGKLAPSFLSKLKEVDSKAYYESFTPHFLEGLKEVKMDKFLTKFEAAIGTKNDKGEVVPDVKTITELVGSLREWLKDMEASAKPVVDQDTPERKKFLEEKTQFEAEKKTAAETKQKAYEEGVATDCEKSNNNLLGKALGPFLKMPFFKGFPRETLVDLGNGIKDRLYTSLKADKVYQTQMNAFWKSKSQDKDKIVAYHNQKVQAMADDIVRKTVQARYPNYAKGGSAAGKAAAAADKKVTATKAAVQSVTSGKPIYVASRPTNLIREDITVNGKTYTSSDLITMQITGKGYVKTPDGKGFRYVTWRK
jgi:hypothetical protein